MRYPLEICCHAVIMESDDKMELNVSNYSYDSIKYFISVASYGSLLRASYSLGISQSALSQSMKSLEQSLNVKLFNRNTRGIILTNEGKNLYEFAKTGDRYFKEAIINTLRTNQSISLTTFKIAAPQSLLNNYIFPIMKNMVAKYNNVNFEFVSYIKETDIVQKLQNSDVDLVIDKTNAKFVLKEIVSRIIAENNYYFIYNPEFFNFEDVVKMKDLEKFPIIIKERDGKNDNSWMKASFKRLIICHHDDNILDLIKNGVGIGLYPNTLAEKEGLKILNLKDYNPTKRTVEAFYLESNDIAKEFVNEIIKMCKKIL